MADGRQLVLCADADRDGRELPGHAVTNRWGYCSQCGRTWPQFGAPYVRGTRDDAYARLMPGFLDHRCPGTPA